MDIYVGKTKKCPLIKRLFVKFAHNLSITYGNLFFPPSPS